MANRHKNFNELLTKEFQSNDFFKVYLSELIEDEGLSLREALKKTIISMGLQNYANKVNIPVQHVSDFVSGRRNFRIETIDKHLRKAFNLMIKTSIQNVA